jgi:hypothetical protein
MAQRALVRHEFIGADDINGNNVRCPRDTCHSNTLVLYGNSQVTRVETLAEGKIINVKLDESSHAFELEVIECLTCGTRWHIKTREVVELERRNEELRQRLIATTGDDPYGVGKAN